VKAKAKRMLGTITRKARIANRTFFGLIQPRLTPGNEFVGWHGTNAVRVSCSVFLFA
jgi:hypothetical protein